MKHHPVLPGRQDLVHQVRDRLLRESAPRLQLVLIVGLAGLAAFLSSILTLRLGVPWMAVRYPLAVASSKRRCHAIHQRISTKNIA